MQMLIRIQILWHLIWVYTVCFGPFVQILRINTADVQGPIVQSIVSLTSWLKVKMLTVLVSTISNSQIFLLKKLSSFCKCKSYSHFFSKNTNIVYAIFNDQSFNDTLTNDIVSFEQLGPEF